VWETHEVQVINNVATDERIQGSTRTKETHRSYQAANIFSSLVPLICQQELMAVLALHQCGSRAFG